VTRLLAGPDGHPEVTTLHGETAEVDHHGVRRGFTQPAQDGGALARLNLKCYFKAGPPQSQGAFPALRGVPADYRDCSLGELDGLVRYHAASDRLDDSFMVRKRGTGSFPRYVPSSRINGAIFIVHLSPYGKRGALVGWYFRKSLGFGPFRLNLSKSGIGYSFGVRGARIGSGPHGNYVRLGRDGVYYQKYAGKGSSAWKPAPETQSGRQSVTTAPTREPSELLDASAADLLNEIRDKRSRTRWAPVFALSAGVVLVVFVNLSPEPLRALVLAIVGLFIWLQLRKLDEARKMVHLTYALDSQAKSRYDALLHAIESLSTCAGIWRATSKQVTGNPKYSAGASSAVERVPVSFRRALPQNVQINLNVAGLDLGDQTAWFLPDRVLLSSSASVGAVEYPTITCGLRPTIFVEDGPVPSDAQVLRTTWKHANRDGGPDRRFATNRQMPVVQYAELDIESSTGMFFLLHVSSLEKAQLFRQGLLMYTAAGSGSEAGSRHQSKAGPDKSSSQAAQADHYGVPNERPHKPDETQGSHTQPEDAQRNATLIRKILQALEAGNLTALRASAPMLLGPDEICHISVEGCAYLAGAYSSNPKPDIGNLYLTNKRLRYVGERASVELMMKKIYLSLLNPEVPTWITATMKTTLHCTRGPGVVQVISGTDPTVFHLAGCTPLVNELIAVAIRKISAAAKQQTSERKQASSRQTEHTSSETTAKNPRPSPWEVLQVSPSATAEEIAAAYRKMAQLYHPDKSRDTRTGASRTRGAKDEGNQPGL
jgi:hypothetical protein